MSDTTVYNNTANVDSFMSPEDLHTYDVYVCRSLSTVVFNSRDQYKTMASGFFVLLKQTIELCTYICRIMCIYD